MDRGDWQVIVHGVAKEFIRGWGAAARPGNHFACRGIQVWEGAEGGTS